MEFQEINGIRALINSEGQILKIVENIDHNEAENERLYIRGNCLKGKYQIYAKLNDAVLEMFFQGRLSVKELFLLRKDEEYIMEQNDVQEFVFCDEDFETKVLSTIEYGNSHYYTLPKDMRLGHPFSEALSIVKKNYMNGIGAISSMRNTGRNWISRNL